MTPQSQQQLEASQREAQQLAQKVQGLEARLNVARTKHYEQVAAIQVLESRAKLLEDEALEKATALRNAQIEQASLHKELEALRAKLENAQGGSPVAAAAETTADVVLLKAELKAANDQLQKARGDAEAQWAEAKARVSEAQGRSQKAADAAAQAAQAAELVAQHVKAMDKRLKVAVSRAQKSEQRVDELREAAEGHDALVNELVAARETIDQLQDALARAHAGETSHSPPDPAKNPSRVADQAHERSDLERKEDKDVELGSAPADEDVDGDEAPASDVPLASDVAQESQDDLTEQLATAQRERDELASIVGKLKADLELPAEDDISMGAPQHPAPMTRRETEATDGQWRAGYFIVEAENVVLRQNIARLEGAGGDANTSLELVLDDIIRILKAQREDFEQEVARWRESRASFGLQMQKWVEFAQSVSPSQEGEVTMDSLLEPLQDTLEVANRAIDMAQGLLEEQHDSMVQRRQA